MSSLVQCSCNKLVELGGALATQLNSSHLDAVDEVAQRSVHCLIFQDGADSCRFLDASFLGAHRLQLVFEPLTESQDQPLVCLAALIISQRPQHEKRRDRDENLRVATFDLLFEVRMLVADGLDEEAKADQFLAALYIQ